MQTGRTRGLSSVRLEERVPPWRRGSGSGWLSAEARLLPAFIPTRQPRELLKLSGRTQEIQRLIGRSCAPVLTSTCWGSGPGSSTVMRSRSLPVSVWRRSPVAGLDRCLLGQPATFRDLRQSPVSATGGRHRGRPGGSGLLLDLDTSEGNRVMVDLTVEIDDRQQLLEIHGTAEGLPFSCPQLDGLLDLACCGITELQAAQRDALLRAPFQDTLAVSDPAHLPRTDKEC
jgi:ribonuclease PH